MLNKIYEVWANPKVREWVISSFLSFLTGFSTVVGISVKELSVETFSVASLLGIVFAGIRAGWKLLLEEQLKKRLSV